MKIRLTNSWPFLLNSHQIENVDYFVSLDSISAAEDRVKLDDISKINKVEALEKTWKEIKFFAKSTTR